MDVQMAVFHCADGFLKQLMVTKLSQCQYALPLLVPDPDTQQIEFPLWTFRQINKSWKIRNTNNEAISQREPIYKAETPMVFFFRFGSVSSSKSQLMNNLINEKHNTFFHRNCPGSSRTRVLMDGVVEIAWFCPSGSYDDKFTECVAFCNLHGDAGDHEKQLQILTEMASVNVVLLPRLDSNDRNMIKLQEYYEDSKPLICLHTEDVSTVTETQTGQFTIGLKGRNQSDVSEELYRAINVCLSESSSTFSLKDVSKHSDIRVDEEDDDDCRRGRAAAQQMMSLLEKKDLTEIKESFLPHQGKLWHQWSQKNKELHRPPADEIETDIRRKQTEMRKIRQQQHRSYISEFMKLFIKEMNSDAANEKVFFLKWLRILLDEYTSADISDLHQKYHEKWSTVLKRKEYHYKSEQLKAEQADLERMSEDLQAVNFGLEHIMREIGQIYESCSSVNENKKDLQVHFSSLPSLAAEMMISGFPLELMDGDAAHVPVIWISAVLDQLIQKLGDETRVFVLSVLGLQSSGKSTMLNAMFGLQFAVSAGRCTRGAFMQLLRMSDKMKTEMNFDYILVVDTEGLRALELAGRSIRHHDNELATFVVGLGNLTLINIFGENTAEMQDILQIVVQAFMRMKKVRLNPSCVFVHQNVSDVTAGERNMKARRRLQETLDEMTKLAAKEEVYDEECFSDVIRFDVQKDVKYISQLWEGNPPMAPPNPKYCENIQQLKETIMSHASESHGIVLNDFKDHIKDLWEDLLNERFVFSFRNSLKISAYRKLETEYRKWSWSLRSAMMESENKLYNKIENEAIHEVEETDLRIDALRTHHENTLCEKSKQLAFKLRDKANDEETLKKVFDEFWKQWIKMIIKDIPAVRDIDIMRDVKEILSDIIRHRSTSAVIFGEIICEKLKELIEQSVYKKTARYIANYMRTNFESLNGNRSNLEKHILKTLAEEEDFNKYMNYIHNPRDHYKSFIRDEVRRYITDQFSVSVLPKMKENIERLQQEIMRAARESTEHVQVNRGDAGLWLKSFTQQLSEELIFSEKHLSGVKHDYVEDFNLLEDVMRQELPDIMSEISSRFNTKSFPVNLDYNFRPDELLIDHFCQCCWVQCPFCKSICTNTIENHDGDHNVAFHRVTGINGHFYRGTTNLCISLCTTAVASDQCFYPNGGNDKFLWKEYRKAGGVYAYWSITPDVSELPYWKWFVCRFQRDLEKHYNKTFQGCGKIPHAWRRYSKQDAIESLDKCL
ncbi:interferon-induced very large GTPase 1-like [Sinocyclocheilus rhinocerous]|uniref:interferon-induced very large GTPase 1-like n=1 Tax=Sinocyclocheilus rhinocerous TaxID=307959 RepID=UPI0007B8DDB2|nr:PREDICTED: interferon-induced very large GTPase 1-like [Sinocyclocheilus rhinocerous]